MADSSPTLDTLKTAAVKEIEETLSVLPYECTKTIEYVDLLIEAKKDYENRQRLCGASTTRAYQLDDIKKHWHTAYQLLWNARNRHYRVGQDPSSSFFEIFDQVRLRLIDNALMIVMQPQMTADSPKQVIKLRNDTNARVLFLLPL